jgi:hypothetical protein
MIEKDKSRTILLQTIHFEFVSSHLLKTFFDSIQIDEIDYELFESLKKRLFTDYSDQEKLSNRWKSKPNFLSQTETSELLDILGSYFNKEVNPIEATKLLVKQNRKLKQDVESLQERISQLEKEKLSLGKTISYQNGHSGIIQDLKQTQPNSVSLRCSSIDEGQPDNFFHYDDSFWFSQNLLNSWICIKFNAKKIYLSGYLLRSYYGSSFVNPKTWKLEASNDSVHWFLIDEQNNRNWVTKDWSEMYFPVEMSKPFSIFKFTQTGKSILNRNIFLLYIVKLLGIVLNN